MAEIIKFADGTPGSIINENDDWYYADRTLMNNTGLSEVKKGPLHYKKFLEGVPSQDTEAFAWGRAFHCIILEPNEFTDRFFILEEEDMLAQIGGAKPRATKAYKEWKAEQLDEAGSRDILNKDSYDVMRYLRDKVEALPQLRELLNSCAKEKIMAATINDVPCKMKADAVNYGNFLIDLKTTSGLVTDFEYSFNKYEYDRQMAFYADIAQVSNVYIIAVEKSSPNGIGYFEIRPETLQRGRDKYNYLLDKYNNDFLKGGIQDFDTYYHRAFL